MIWHFMQIVSRKYDLTLHANCLFIFLIFPRKYDLTLHANCLLRDNLHEVLDHIPWRQFAWSVRSYFLRKNKKNISKCRLLKFYPACKVLGKQCRPWSLIWVCTVANVPVQISQYNPSLHCILTPHITKTRLYNIDPLKPHFYIVKLGFTGVYIIFLISAQKHRLWVLVRTASPRRS